MFIRYAVTLLFLLAGHHPVFASSERGPEAFGELAIAPSSGLALVELLKRAVEDEARRLNREPPAVVAFICGSDSGARLTDAMDRTLLKWFTYLAVDPRETMILSAIQELYYEFLKHAGALAINSPATPDLIKDEIGRFIRPKPRNSKSCHVHLASGPHLEWLQ